MLQFKRYHANAAKHWRDMFDSFVGPCMRKCMLFRQIHSSGELAFGASYRVGVRTIEERPSDHLAHTTRLRFSELGSPDP